MLNLRQIYNRIAESESILRFLSKPVEKLLLVTGESGCGKSITVERALALADERGIVPVKSVLSYRFNDPNVEDEAERFPQFLMDSFSQVRSSWFLENWMRNQGTSPDSWALRLPFASFNFRPPNLRDPYKAEAFFTGFAKALGNRYLIFRIENAENFTARHNLIALEKLTNQPDGPKLIVEIGTLSTKASEAIKFFRQRCKATVLEVRLFNSEESIEYYRFVHSGNIPSSLLETSHGNALAIRHHGTAFADLPVSDKIRQRLEGFSSNAMILLWSLAALRGTSDIEFLKRISQLDSVFDSALIELRQADVVRIDNDLRVKFAHSLFTGYFLSDSFAMDLRIFGRQRIINHLKSQKQITITNACELARQYYGIGDYESAAEWAVKSACESYRQENFRAVLNVAEILDVCQDIPPSLQRKANMLLLQTAIRIGDVTSVIKWIAKLDEDKSGTAILLRAQGYYLMNRFEEAIRLCSKISRLAGDNFLASRALGIRAASFIALGQHEEAANAFAAARQIALATGDRELDLELLRLSPEIESEVVWKTRFDELKKSKLPDRYPYLYAKCLHNFGVCMLLESAGEHGVEELNIAAAVFENGRYPEYSYAAVMSAAALLLGGQTVRARMLLEDAEIWCHEQYDAFGFKTNFGVAAALDNEWKTANRRFAEAQNILDEAAFPLTDPYFHFQAKHNLAMAAAALSQYNEAIRYLETVDVPKNCYDYEAKMVRREQFISLLRQGRMPTIADCPLTASRWTTRTCIMELATLQFFDFNVNVLSRDFL